MNFIQRLEDQGLIDLFLILLLVQGGIILMWAVAAASNP